jgi:hypothetical protein
MKLLRRRVESAADSGLKRPAVDHSANDGTGHISISWLPVQESPHKKTETH